MRKRTTGCLDYLRLGKISPPNYIPVTSLTQKVFLCQFGHWTHKRHASLLRTLSTRSGVGDAFRIRVGGDDGIDPLDGLLIDAVASLCFYPSRLGCVGFTSDRVPALPIHIRGHPGPSGTVRVEGYEDNICARESEAVDGVFD